MKFTWVKNNATSQFTEGMRYAAIKYKFFVMGGRRPCPIWGLEEFQGITPLGYKSYRTIKEFPTLTELKKWVNQNCTDDTIDTNKMI